MKIIAAVLLLLTGPLAAQTITPSQIKPGTNGQTIQTVGGKAAWANTAAGVTSFGPAGFPRTGVIVPVTGDYICSQVTGAICSIPTLFNQLIKVDGASLTQRGIVNFINGSAGTVSCVDNPVTLATDCTITGGSTTGVTWTISDVSGSRSVGTAQQNTSSWPMFVGGSLATTGSGTGSITVAQGPSSFSMTLIDWKNQSTATVSSGSAGFTAVIAPGNFYVVQVSGAVTTSKQSWTEMTGSGGGGGGGGGGFTAGGDLAGSSSSQQVVGLDGVPFCSGYTPTNGQFIELTTGSSPNPCYTATTPSGSGNTTSTSLTTSRIPKANGANSIIDSSISDNGTTVSTTEPLTAPAVNTVINAGSSLSAAVTACGSANTTIQITQTIAVGTGITVPANCTLLFQSAGNLTGTSIVISGAVQAPPVQIFASGLAVTGMKNSARPEWWGAVPYSSIAAAASGANDVAKAQKVFTALTGGGVMELQCAYYHIGGLVITGAAQGILGDCTAALDGSGVSQPSTASTIVDTSASETIVDIHGTSPSVVLSGIIMQHVALQRTVLPTGTARGLSLNYLNQAFIEDVSSADSVDDFWIHNSGNNGKFDRLVGVWGFSVVSGASYTSGSQHAINLDSNDGVGEDTLRITNGQAICAAMTTSTTWGIYANGTNSSDINTDFFTTGSCSHGIDVENTGTGSPVGQDIQFNNSLLNVCLIDCLKINGVQSTLDVGPHVYVQGGNFFPVGTNSVGILVSSSTNIGIAGAQILPGGSGITDISLSSVDGFTLSANTIDGVDFGTGVGISLLNSTKGTISNNQIKLYTSGTGIKNVGSTLISEQGNSIAAPTGGVLANGITFDSGSSNNGPWSLNSIDAATVTTPVTDAGTHNNDPTLNSSRMSKASSTVFGVAECDSTTITCAGGIFSATAGGGGTVVDGAGTTTPGLVAQSTSTTHQIAYSAALANGTTATTQTALDNTTKLATDAFVLANSFPNPMTTAGDLILGGSLGTPGRLGIGSNGQVLAISGGVVQWATASANTVSTTLTTNKLPKANGANSIIDSSVSDDGTTVSTIEDIAALTYRSSALSVSTLPICPNGASGKFTVSGCNAATATSLLSCADTSASGTAQTCTTTPTFTPAANSCVIYTTTTANSGAGLTLNVNSLGAKSVAKWLGTTTLAAGDVAANSPQLACYNGTVWNLSTIGNAPAGGGGVSSWSGDGAFYSNSGSTGAVTGALVTAAAHKFWGNNTSSTATPAYDLIGTSDWSPNSYIVGAGSVNVMTATLSPAATALTAGLQLDVLPNLANTTTTPTLNVNGLGAKTITKCGTVALVAADYTTTGVAELIYDGTEFQLLNPGSIAGCAGGGGFSVGSNGAVTARSITLNVGGISSTGVATVLHLVGSAGAPTIAAGTGAGTGPTLTATLDTDLSGYVQVLTGTTPTASASVFTVTFSTAYATAPKCVLWPDNAATQALTGIAAVQIFDPSTTVATAMAGATGLVAATTYKWGYTCTQ